MRTRMAGKIMRTGKKPNITVTKNSRRNNPWAGLPGNVRGILLMTLAVMFGILMDSCVKALGGRIGTTQIVFVRSLAAMAALIPIAMVLGWQRLATRRPGFHLLRGVLNAAATTLTFFALTELPVAEVNAYLFAEPLFVMPLAVLLLGERPPLKRVVAVLVGFIGVMIILRPDIGGVTTGALAALGAVLSWAIFVVVLKHMTMTEDTLAMLFWAAVVVSALSAPAAIASWRTPAPADWLLLIAIGILSLIVHFCIIRAYAAGEASAVAPASYAALPFGAVADLLFFDGLPRLEIWIGAVLIIVGVSAGAQSQAARRNRQGGKQGHGAQKE